MTYLFCTLFMQVLAIRQVFSITGSKRTVGDGGTAAKLVGAGIILAAALLSAPIFLEVTQAMAFANGKPVSLGGEPWALGLMGAGALVVLAVFTYRTAMQIKAKTSHFFAVGANVFGLFIGLYMAFVVTDQLSFYSSPNDTGMLSWAMMKDDPSLRSIRCDSDFLVVRGFDSGTATFRCPAPLQLIYGRLSGKPIVLWPGFTEGKSAELAQAIKRLQNDAIRIGSTKHAK
jgi:hypothetical protein